MVLDALTALGLAANVIQFVEFSSRVLSKSREWHQSSTGQLLEHQEIDVATIRLDQLCRGIEGALRRNPSKSASTLTLSEESLKQVAHECLEMGQELRHGLQKFAAQPGQSKWKSFRQAFKTLWTKDGLERMQHRLAQQREQLTLHLLMVMSQRQDKELANLNQQSSSLEGHILRAIREANQTLKADLDILLQPYNTQSDGNRESFPQDFEKWRSSHEHDLQRLSDEVAQQFSPPTTQTTTGIIIQSLHFPQIRDRKLQIGSRPAYPNTFRWIFDKAPEGELQAPNFARWLEETQNSSHLFWFTGRPGSGKSTLMHFLSEAPETGAAMQSWRGDHVLLSASAFFWLAGAPIQKSLNGLLRSLLHDILIQDPSLTVNIARWRWRSYTYGAKSLPEWSDVELMEALNSLIVATLNTHRMFLLADGLDEYEASFAEQNDLVGFLKGLADRPNVKLCVSSRPWPVFESGFGICPHLRLEDLTRGDIQLYIEVKFAQIREFEDIRALYPDGCQRIVNEILEKAQGVFLWVYLVTVSMSQGLVEGDTMQQLWDRLAEIPNDLEKYFRQIILAIPKQHRSIAASYFGILTATTYTVSLVSLSFLEESRTDIVQLTPFQPVPLASLQARKRSMTRRLESRCRGLLQVSHRPNLGNYLDSYVDYLHRTVRDFLLSEEIHQILQEYSPQPLDPYVFLCETILAQLKMIEDDDPDLPDLCAEFFTFARELEHTQGPAHVSLTDDFFKLAYQHLLRTDRDRALYGSVGATIKVSILWRLPEYAKAKAESSELDVNKQYCSLPALSGPIVTEPSLLLHECIRPWKELKANHLGVDALAPAPLEAVIAALLAKGADPNMDVDKSGVWEETVWEQFLRHAREIRHNDTSWLRAAQHFVRHGAAAIARSPSLNSATRQDIARLLEEIFPGPDGKQLAEELRRRKKPKKGFRRLFSGSK